MNSHTPKLVVEQFPSVASAQKAGCFEWASETNDWGPVGVVWVQTDSGSTTGLPGSVETTLPYARMFAAAPTMLEALKAAEQFIRNGIELGFIRVPDADTADPAHETLPTICAAIRAATGEG